MQEYEPSRPSLLVCFELLAIWVGVPASVYQDYSGILHALIVWIEDAVSIHWGPVCRCPHNESPTI